MRVIDFHCDTPKLLYEAKQPLDLPLAMAGKRATASYRPYVQLSACFCPQGLSASEGFSAVCGMLSHLKGCVVALPDCALIDTANALQNAIREGKAAYIPCIEDARVLDGVPSRTELLFSLGVRLITPLWRGVSVMGGAWDTDEGLSGFGKESLSHFLSLGGLLDVSHASRKAHADMLVLCRAHGKAPLATHSNAFTLTPHKRNLTDAQIREIAECGGVVGLNLYPKFLTKEPVATMDDLLAHLRHILRVGGSEVAVLGSDLDGVDALPQGFTCALGLSAFAEHMQKNGFTPSEIDRFFFENGKRYLLENLPQGTDV